MPPEDNGYKFLQENFRNRAKQKTELFDSSTRMPYVRDKHGPLTMLHPGPGEQRRLNQLRIKLNEAKGKEA